MLFVAPRREYIEHDLEAFKQRHAHVDVRTKLNRGHHPYVEAEFGASPLRLRSRAVRHANQRVDPMPSAAAAPPPNLRTAFAAARPPLARRRAAARPHLPPQPPPLPPPPAAHALPEKADKTHSHTVSLRNYARPDIQRELWWLASSQGRPQSSRAPPRRVISRRPSIQGAWSVVTFDAAAAAAAQRQQ